MIKRLIREESGQSAVEYAMMVGMLGIGLFAAAQVITEVESGLFESQHKALSDWKAP